MSSKFSTGSVRLIPPSWCKKGMFVGILPTINDRPLSMNAYVHVTFSSSGVDVDLDTTVHLSRDDPAGKWKGSIDDGDLQTTVTVRDTPDPELFTLSVRTSELGSPLTRATWPWTQPLADDRWDTGTLLRVHNPDVNEVALHLLA